MRIFLWSFRRPRPASRKTGPPTSEWERFSKPLEHYHFDNLTLPTEEMGNLLIVFTLDAKGAVARMKVLGNMDAQFQRRR